MRLILTILSVAFASFLLISANTILSKFDVAFINNKFINNILKYQIFAFLVAVVAFLISVKFTPESKFLIKIGNLETLSVKERWMGINGRTFWKSNGAQGCISNCRLM